LSSISYFNPSSSSVSIYKTSEIHQHVDGLRMNHSHSYNGISNLDTEAKCAYLSPEVSTLSHIFILNIP